MHLKKLPYYFEIVYTILYIGTIIILKSISKNVAISRFCDITEEKSDVDIQLNDSQLNQLIYVFILKLENRQFCNAICDMNERTFCYALRLRSKSQRLFYCSLRVFYLRVYFIQETLRTAANRLRSSLRFRKARAPMHDTISYRSRIRFEENYKEQNCLTQKALIGFIEIFFRERNSRERRKVPLETT